MMCHTDKNLPFNSSMSHEFFYVLKEKNGRVPDNDNSSIYITFTLSMSKSGVVYINRRFVVSVYFISVHRVRTPKILSLFFVFPHFSSNSEIF